MKSSTQYLFVGVLSALLMMACTTSQSGQVNTADDYSSPTASSGEMVITTLDATGEVVPNEEPTASPRLPQPEPEAAPEPEVAPEPVVEPKPEHEATQRAQRPVERPKAPSRRSAKQQRQRSVPLSQPPARPVEQSTQNHEVTTEFDARAVPAQQLNGPTMLALPGATPGSYAQTPLLRGPVYQVNYEPVVRPRRHGYDYFLTNNQSGGRLVGIEYLNVKFVPCAGYVPSSMAVVDEASRVPVSAISNGAQACFTMADGACSRGGSCKVGFRLVRYSAPRSQIETTPLPGGGFARRTVLYVSRLPRFNGDTIWLEFPANKRAWITDFHDPL